MEPKPEKDTAAAQMYYTEILNLLQKANEPLRLSIMLLSMATTLKVAAPPVVIQCIGYNKELCDRMQFIASSAKSSDLLN